MALHGVPAEPDPDGRGVLLRPLVRLGAVAHPRGVRGHGRPRPGEADRPLHVLDGLHRSPRGVVRAAVGRSSSGGRGPTAEAGILVRPHPFSEQWPKGDLGLENLVVWPPGGQEPIERDSRQNYYDSLYHSDAVVGINTSALIEAAILGRPVHTILDDEFAETQKGTLHFHYLQNPDFGHLVVAGTLGRAQAAACGIGSRRSRPGTERAVRPLVPASARPRPAGDEPDRRVARGARRGSAVGPRRAPAAARSSSARWPQSPGAASAGRAGVAGRAAAPGARSTPRVGSRLPAREDPLRHEEPGRGSPRAERSSACSLRTDMTSISRFRA